jgi:hypothetical protein
MKHVVKKQNSVLYKCEIFCLCSSNSSLVRILCYIDKKYTKVLVPEIHNMSST